MVKKRGCHSLGAWSSSHILWRWLVGMATSPRDAQQRFQISPNPSNATLVVCHYSSLSVPTLQSAGLHPIPRSRCGHVAGSCHWDRNRHEIHNSHIICLKGNLFEAYFSSAPESSWNLDIAGPRIDWQARMAKEWDEGNQASWIPTCLIAQLPPSP